MIDMNSKKEKNYFLFFYLSKQNLFISTNIVISIGFFIKLSIFGSIY